MKTMKFQPLREKRQECYNVEDYELLNHNFDGINKRVYSNANLSIFVDDYCNADCEFCVAQLRFENRGKMYQKKKIQDDIEYLGRLEKVFKQLAPLDVSVSITGGEPTKSKKIIPILQLINKYGLRKRTITTNGSGLFDQYDNKPVIEHIAENNFQHINISRAHYDEEINKKIMRYQDGYCSNEMMEKIISYSKMRNLRPRMSCILLQDGIHDLDGIIKYMEFYKDMGLDNVIFRETMDFDEKKMSNIEKIDYCKRNKVFLNDIWKEIDKSPEFEPIRNLIGYYYYVEVYKYKGIDMCSEGANLVKIYDEKEKNKDVVYEMVFHPNGNLNGSWVDDEDILLKY